jgi:hypothetical protein
MNSLLSETTPQTANDAVVAVYKTHMEAEAAVRKLAAAAIPVNSISIVGRNYETREDVVGYFNPGDAALTGAGQGAWFGGLFGLMLGAFGFFIFPAVGTLIVLGPLSGFIAGAVGGAGIGALVSALVAAGIPHDQALKYRDRLQAGEFVVVVHGGAGNATLAHEVLSSTDPNDLQCHSEASGI